MMVAHGGPLNHVDLSPLGLILVNIRTAHYYSDVTSVISQIFGIPAVCSTACPS